MAYKIFSVSMPFQDLCGGVRFKCTMFSSAILLCFFTCLRKKQVGYVHFDFVTWECFGTFGILWGTNLVCQKTKIASLSVYKSCWFILISFLFCLLFLKKIVSFFFEIFFLVNCFNHLIKILHFSGLSREFKI